MARLEKVGLRPAPPADKRTLIRRATFDLIGLPPSPEEIEAIKTEVVGVVDDAVSFAEKSPRPAPEDALKDVYAD